MIMRACHKVHKKTELDWKDPEEDQIGLLVGGGIVIWVGVLLMLLNQGFLRGVDFGGFFMMGIGVILVLGGVLGYLKTGGYSLGFGFMVGGGIMILIGASLRNNFHDWWAFLLIGLGVIIILGSSDRVRLERNVGKQYRGAE
jgi:hypothetical protein